MKIKIVLTALLYISLSSCYERGVIHTWVSCSNIQNSYINALKQRCGEEVAQRHYNLVKTDIDSNGEEHFYCKEKYGDYIGSGRGESRFDSIDIVHIGEELNENICNKLKSYIGKRVEEEDVVLRMQMSLSNTKSCIALNDIFKMELDDKCGDEADALWNQHKSTWNNEKYYCEEYNGTKVGRDNVFPASRNSCLQGMEKSTCEELKTLIGKKIENYLQYGGLLTEDSKGSIYNIKGYF